eukprot:1158856-Pelagomonas_calceolata.AAC.11
MEPTSELATTDSKPLCRAAIDSTTCTKGTDTHMNTDEQAAASLNSGRQLRASGGTCMPSGNKCDPSYRWTFNLPGPLLFNQHQHSCRAQELVNLEALAITSQAHRQAAEQKFKHCNNQGITRYTLEFKLYTEAQHFKSTAINIPPTSVTLPNVAFLQEKRHQ